jgi:hypothetical protein
MASRSDPCAVCGSHLTERGFRITVPGGNSAFDTVECAIRGSAPVGSVEFLSRLELLAAELFVARAGNTDVERRRDELEAEARRLAAEVERERARADRLRFERDRLLVAASDRERGEGR